MLKPFSRLPLFSVYTMHAKEVLRTVYNDPIDVGGLWEEACKELQKELGETVYESAKETLNRWFWEEDLPLEMLKF